MYLIVYLSEPEDSINELLKLRIPVANLSYNKKNRNHDLLYNKKIIK